MLGDACGPFACMEFAKSGEEIAANLHFSARILLLQVASALSRSDQVPA